MRFTLAAGDVPLDADFLARYRLLAAVFGVTPFGTRTDLARMVARCREGT